jgi:small subunit ribosomal protein S3
VGQKVNPIGFRRGVYTSWDSRWFARGNGKGKSYAQSFLEDLAIQNLVKKHLSSAEVSRIEIEKTEDSVRVIIHSARPGQVIGKKGQDIETLRGLLAKSLNKKTVEVSVQEIRKPELDARLIARDIAEQMERRGSYKRAMKKAAADAMRSGARGIAVRVAGRLAGAEIARDEKVSVGSLPRHTLRSNIDYGADVAHTTYGVIGVKVWICHGDFKVTQ